MKLPLRLPSGAKRFWRGCRIEEKLVLGAASLLVPFCLGFEYSIRQSKPTLPPLFHPSPEENTGQENMKSGHGKGGFLLVHVAGKVKRPGLQKLPEGSRVFEAIEACGGATDVRASNALNLASRVQDGQKIVVGAVPQTRLSPTRLSPTHLKTTSLETARQNLQLEPASSSSSHRKTNRKALPAHPINLNTASALELEALPGVGPALASRIVAARRVSRLKDLSDLDRVKGIGPKKLEEMRPYATF